MSAKKSSQTNAQKLRALVDGWSEGIFDPRNCFCARISSESTMLSSHVCFQYCRETNRNIKTRRAISAFKSHLFLSISHCFLALLQSAMLTFLILTSFVAGNSNSWDLIQSKGLENPSFQHSRWLARLFCSSFEHLLCTGKSPLCHFPFPVAHCRVTFTHSEVLQQTDLDAVSKSVCTFVFFFSPILD